MKLERLGNKEYWCESRGAFINYSPMMRFWMVRVNGVIWAYDTLKECRAALANPTIQLTIEV